MIPSLSQFDHASKHVDLLLQSLRARKKCSDAAALFLPSATENIELVQLAVPALLSRLFLQCQSQVGAESIEVNKIH